METTTATYSISVTTDEGIATFYKTMPTKPKHQKESRSEHKVIQMGRKKLSNSLSTEILPAK